MSGNFLTGRNLMNVARQSTYLCMVAMGQMLALLTGGFDLSVGTILAVTSVVGALAMSTIFAAHPDMAVKMMSARMSRKGRTPSRTNANLTHVASGL
jgi:ribose/xylose/arabinose/galactoside ABC-type transport system permease subunit